MNDQINRIWIQNFCVYFVIYTYKYVSQLTTHYFMKVHRHFHSMNFDYRNEQILHFNFHKIMFIAQHNYSTLTDSKNEC